MLRTAVRHADGAPFDQGSWSLFAYRDPGIQDAAGGRSRGVTLALAAGLLSLALCVPTLAQQPVQAQGAWARATPPHASTGAIYLTLTSPAGDRLTGASSPVAGKAAVHEMRMDGDIMRMRPVKGGLDLPAGKPVTLAPDGIHIMLEGLKAPLTPGQAVPVHLTFKKAPPLDIEAQVRGIGAPGPSTAGSKQPGQGVMPGMTMGK